MELDNSTIGNSIRSLREKAKISCTELSSAIDVSVNHLYQVEEGHRGIGVNMLINLMKFFQADANTILGIVPGLGVPEHLQLNGFLSTVQRKMEILPEDAKKYLEATIEQMVDREVYRLINERGM